MKSIREQLENNDKYNDKHKLIVWNRNGLCYI